MFITFVLHHGTMSVSWWISLIKTMNPPQAKFIYLGHFQSNWSFLKVWLTVFWSLIYVYGWRWESFESKQDGPASKTSATFSFTVTFSSCCRYITCWMRKQFLNVCILLPTDLRNRLIRMEPNQKATNQKKNQTAKLTFAKKHV